VSRWWSWRRQRAIQPLFINHSGRPVISQYDLTDERGLVHLRHALTYDANFQWNDRRTESIADAKWRCALRFVKDDRELVVLLTEDFEQLGKFDHQRRQVDVLPCPRLGQVLARYFADVRTLLGDASERPR
jgi:hypothetical protein